ncbi:hypothetical protein PIB30_050857 [Stylosanthes scabra]|uniref:Uncharacterized protein n=1 Tax=Stylosanthes scabra TaxID=79078 RepID=A0ABU6QH11_9FABA|nr:hypothetical protein [Stylosanthes scabra]
MNATEEMNEGNEPLHLSQLLTQGSVAELYENEDPTLAEAARDTKKIKQQEKEKGIARKQKSPMKMLK